MFNKLSCWISKAAIRSSSRLATALAIASFLGSASAHAADDLNTPLPCDGTALYLSLVASAAPMNFNTIAGLPFVKKGVAQPVPPGQVQPQFRLEVCLADDTQEMTVQRAVVTNSYGDPYILQGAQLQNVVGLKEASFGQAQKFQMDLAVDGDTKLLVRGTSSGLVSLIRLYANEPGKWQLSATDVLTGQLVEGNPFASLKCSLGQSEVKSQFQLGTAQFEVGMCIFLGGGETTGYRIHKMKVTDSSAHLPTALQGKSLEFEGEALKAALNYRWNHHNACDSFVLKVSESGASYAATSGPMAGCGTVVEGAPERNWDDPDKRTKFINRYGTKIEAGTIENGHFLRLY